MLSFDTPSIHYRLKDFVSIFHQLAVAHAFRFFLAQTLLLVLFVFRIRTFEEEHVRIALEGQNVRGTNGRG